MNFAIEENLKTALIKNKYLDESDFEGLNLKDSSKDKVDNIKELIISNSELSDLTGLNNLINLEILDCSFNEIEYVSLVKCTNLTVLKAINCNITYIDLSENKKLKELNLSNNELNSIDLTENMELKYLNLNSTSLVLLKVSNLKKLITLYIEETPIILIDVRNCKKLKNFSYTNTESTANLIVNIKQFLSKKNKWESKNDVKVIFNITLSKLFKNILLNDN